jgi:hypothetical protein
VAVRQLAWAAGALHLLVPLPEDAELALRQTRSPVGESEMLRRAWATLLHRPTAFTGEPMRRTTPGELQFSVGDNRPWERTFLGYGLTWHKVPRRRVARDSRQRLVKRIRAVLKGARGRSPRHTIAVLNPLLGGWAAYFTLTETRRVLEDLDGWVRRKLRCILWRQWKRPSTRQRNLMKAGLTPDRAWRSASNGRGPWWNSGASHMNQAYRQAYFGRLGLVSLLENVRRLQSVP